MTDFEMIKSMTLDEMAEFLKNSSNNLCLKLNGEYIVNEIIYIKEWLESEVVDAKIKRIRDLQSEKEELTNEFDGLKKQMEWLTGYNQNLMSANTALSEEIFIAKIEAYKEFATKIYQTFAIENTRDGYLNCTPNYTRLMECVDNVLKELVGAENE